MKRLWRRSWSAR